MKQNRLLRRMELRAVEGGEGEKTYKIRGYASTFEPYVLWRDGDTDYYEVIDAQAFKNTDMSDVVLRVDHAGKVYARNRANCLEIGTDEHGLWFEADLSETETQRSLYEDVAAGLYPQASFAFTVREEAYNRDTHTRTILDIEKLFDVSVVSFPANPGTEVDVATRAWLDGEIELEKAERLEVEKRQRNKEKLQLRIKLLESED